MVTECTQKSFAFHSLGKRQVVARFDGGHIISDGGGVLLREVERHARIVEQFAACFTDHRDPHRIELPLSLSYRAPVARSQVGDGNRGGSDPFLTVTGEARALSGRGFANPRLWNLLKSLDTF